MQDDQYMNYYFSVSMQSWRGMIELGRLMQDYPAQAGSGANATLAAILLSEAQAFRADIDRALNHSVVLNASGHVRFVPAAVTPGRNNATPYRDMTMDTTASYSNFRYCGGRCRACRDAVSPPSLPSLITNTIPPSPLTHHQHHPSLAPHSPPPHSLPPTTPSPSEQWGG